ncbi:hypothetical protein [Actinomadura sp. 3N508]|uniref:hypothetical protein n=1 Tax=Actinomadura sp. 3N508 TaxID=3375153 RepID=UPI0037B14D48
MTILNIQKRGAAELLGEPVAAADGEVCDAGQTYRSRIFRTDTKRVVYTFTAFVKRCAIGDLAFTRELSFDIVEPAVPDPIIFVDLKAFSLPARPPESNVTYEATANVDACFGNPCQRYEHKFFGTSTALFQSGSFALIRLP